MTMPCRCADCGFLAVRNTDTREFAEVELGMLKRWEIPSSTLRPAFKRYEEIPVCFVLAADLKDDISEYYPSVLRGDIDTTEPVIVKLVIERQRECPSFTPRQ